MYYPIKEYCYEGYVTTDLHNSLMILADAFHITRKWERILQLYYRKSLVINRVLLVSAYKTPREALIHSVYLYIFIFVGNQGVTSELMWHLPSLYRK